MVSPSPKAKCPSCGVAFRFKPELAGKTVRCAQCQQTFPLPADPVDENPKARARPSRKMSRGPKTRSVKKTGRQSKREPNERRGSGRRNASGRTGRRSRSKSNPLPFLIIGAVVLVGGLGGLIFALAKKEPPPPGAEPAKKVAQKKSPPRPNASAKPATPFNPEDMEAMKAGVEKFFENTEKEVKTIQALASRGKDGIPLIAAYLDKDGFASLSAAEELAKFGADALPVLKPRLDSPSANTRLAAVNSLARMGPPAAPLRDKLEELAENDPDEKVRGLAAKALERIGS